MAVLNKIRQRSIFLIIIIALALFSFIIGDIFSNMGASDKSQNVVATINGNDISSYESSSFEFILLSGDDLNLESYNGGFQLMIYEYSISGSGSEQGLDYVEP